MKVTIICSDKQHPVYTYLETWCSENKKRHQINLYESIKQIKQGGDILFLISCSEIVRSNIRDLFEYTLVLHASDLPKGRGWSPHIWGVVNGENEITLSLLNAEDGVDTGAIWQKVKIRLDGTELYNEINHKLFKAELELMSWACNNINSAKATPQIETKTEHYRKRTPADSEIDASKTIAEQFNLLRVSDPNRFPAYTYINGQKYKVALEKFDD